MIKSLRLINFKNFKDATLELGKFSLLVGANASGKSNLRDALLFLHGIGRGYNLAETLGEKWGQGGEPVWDGIRGGTKEATFRGEPSFRLQCIISGHEPRWDVAYAIQVAPDFGGRAPTLLGEKLSLVQEKRDVFSLRPREHDRGAATPLRYNVQVGHPNGKTRGRTSKTLSLATATASPFLSAPTEGFVDPQYWPLVLKTLASLHSMRFLDLRPEAMRRPSVPGQVILGDHGENLSSILYEMCSDRRQKETLLEWVRELTPLDATDFRFVPDQAGRILVTLVEAGGNEVSAYSASDGTLRFLALMAAMRGPSPAELYFIEELDTGIHPTRLHLLIEMIEHSVSSRGIQVIATTHSPHLLAMLNEETQEHASLVYRLEGSADGRIRRIMDIPEARRVLKGRNLGRLHESGWLENTVAFLEPDADGKEVKR